MSDGQRNSFGSDVAFLAAHTDLVVLSDASDQAQVAVSPALQGRVLTSTAQGMGGLSFGWINRPVIASGERQEHMNVYGGEDRFWLGPEGGQYSIYFQPGDPFDLDHWQVPPAFDWEPFAVVEASRERVSFEKVMRLTNYSGTIFDLRVDREIRLVTPAAVEEHLRTSTGPDVHVVAFESVNTVTNTGSQAWTRDRGLLSIWVLGMYNPTPQTTVVIPFVEGSEEARGAIVNADYFGTVPAERLAVHEGVLFFRGDGLYRSKIGLTQARIRPTFGSYDVHNRVLTLVQYTMPDSGAVYVNSMWELQSDPYSGDVINSYNDGPPAPGVAPLGPFYELESSSPALELGPGESRTHVHRTIHMTGDEAALDRIAVAALGRSLAEIVAAFEE